MENTLIENAPQAADEVPVAVVTELSVDLLAVVGGGTANVSWL